MIDVAKTDTTIHIGSFTIHQPVTVFTDYIITILCFYFYWRLKRPALREDSTTNWRFFFLFLSLASFFGGSAHGFFAIHEGTAYKSVWLTMQAFNIFSVYRAQQATLYSALQHSGKKQYWNLSYHIQRWVFFVAIFIFQNFLVVIIDLIIGLVPIMIIHFIDAKKIRESAWIAYGILILFLAALVNATRFSLHAYFNYMDIAHILIMINLSAMFIGIKRKAFSSQLA